MTTKTPIKRSQELVVLSQEHHHALVFCTRLKKAYQTDLKTLQHFVSDFWDNEQQNHFDNEEKWLLPEMKEEKLKNQFIEEHQQIRKLIAQIKEAKNDGVELATDLAIILNNHIRFEERVLFPYLEKTIETQKLVIIGEQLSEKEVSCHKFTPEFWKK